MRKGNSLGTVPRATSLFICSQFHCFDAKKKFLHKLTLIISPSISSILSRKSTPMVASTLWGNSPAQSRYVRQVFPTPESPITSTLKVRQRLSSEDTLPKELENSRDDSIYPSFTVNGAQKTRSASNAISPTKKKCFHRRSFTKSEQKVRASGEKKQRVLLLV